MTRRYPWPSEHRGELDPSRESRGDADPSRPKPTRGDVDPRASEPGAPLRGEMGGASQALQPRSAGIQGQAEDPPIVPASPASPAPSVGSTAPARATPPPPGWTSVLQRESRPAQGRRTLLPRPCL